MRPIEFWVTGKPAPAGSKRGFIYTQKETGRAAVAMADSSGAKGRAWRLLVRDAALRAMPGNELLDGPLKVVMTFYQERPKAHYRANGELRKGTQYFPVARPDVLKLARAVEDALTGIVWKDDAQIVIEHLRKEYGPAGARVHVEPITLQV